MSKQGEQRCMWRLKTLSVQLEDFTHALRQAFTKFLSHRSRRRDIFRFGSRVSRYSLLLLCLWLLKYYFWCSLFNISRPWWLCSAGSRATRFQGPFKNSWSYYFQPSLRQERNPTYLFLEYKGSLWWWARHCEHINIPIFDRRSRCRLTVIQGYRSNRFISSGLPRTIRFLNNHRGVWDWEWM